MLDMKDQSRANSTWNGNHVVPRKVLRLQNPTRARRVCVAIVFVALYVLLDRSTVFLARGIHQVDLVSRC